VAVEPCGPVKAQQIALHTQAVLTSIDTAEDVGGVIEILKRYRDYAKPPMAVAPQILDHVEMVANRRIIHLKALAKNGQITSPRNDRSASYTDRMLGEGEK
jgi:hypothetical protein